jgi:intein/homing endonuclease
MKHRPFTKNETDFLVENFVKLGPKKCAKQLRRNWSYVAKKAYSLGLSRRSSNQWKLDKSKQKVNIFPFKKITEPNVSYILGFIWADGYVSKTKNRISVGIGKKDFQDIQNCLLTKIPVHTHIQKRNGNPMFYINDLQLHSFLKENDYCNKSANTPSKILSKIPKKLHNYFFRGYFDGDGCFTKIKTCPTIIWTGSYEQDWKDVSELIMKITNHQPKILRRIMKKGHKNSMLYFYGKDRIRKFLDYLYKGEIIGLSRKRERYEQFTNL